MNPAAVCLSRWVWQVSYNRTCSGRHPRKTPLSSVTVRWLGLSCPGGRAISPFCGLTEAAPPNNNLV